METLCTLREAILKDCQTDRIFDDVTAHLLGAEGEKKCHAIVLSREDGVFSGIAVLSAFEELFKKDIQVDSKIKEGERIKKGDVLAILSGPIGVCLSLERTLLNYLSHLCGVATLTSKFVEKTQNRKTKILATRKTLPGLRDLQLTAVQAGGGYTHRRSLSDGILIKDNHIAMLDEKTLLINAERTRSPLHRVEIEIQNLSQLQKVLEYSPDIIMLDNMSIEDMRTALFLIREKKSGRTRTEISGGVNLETIAKLSELNVDYISVGQLTHSAPSLNLTMDFEK